MFGRKEGVGLVVLLWGDGGTGHVKCPSVCNGLFFLNEI